MEIVTKRVSQWGTIRITPNIRMTVPDDIGDALVRRDMADQIQPDVLELEKKSKKKTTDKGKSEDE